MERIVIYTDGGCSGNPGPGGWAFVYEDGKETLRGSGGEAATTNNRMELRAVIEALSLVARRRPHVSPIGRVRFGRPLHRFAIRQERHHGLDSQLETQRLAHRGQEDP